MAVSGSSSGILYKPTYKTMTVDIVPNFKGLHSSYFLKSNLGFYTELPVNRVNGITMQMHELSTSYHLHGPS